MDDLLRVSAKVNIWFGVLLILLSAFSYFIESILESDMIVIAVRFSVTLAVCSIITGVLAKMALNVRTKEEHPRRAEVMRGIGLAIGIILLLIALFGFIVGISTGTISYVYGIMIPVMLFYCACVRKPKVRASKSKPAVPEAVSAAEAEATADTAAMATETEQLTLEDLFPEETDSIDRFTDIE